MAKPVVMPTEQIPPEEGAGQISSLLRFLFLQRETKGKGHVPLHPFKKFHGTVYVCQLSINMVMCWLVMLNHLKQKGKYLQRLLLHPLDTVFRMGHTMPGVP
jgi:hypothetical protein